MINSFYKLYENMHIPSKKIFFLSSFFLNIIFIIYYDKSHLSLINFRTKICIQGKYHTPTQISSQLKWRFFHVQKNITFLISCKTNMKNLIFLFYLLISIFHSISTENRKVREKTKIGPNIISICFFF